MGRATGFRKRCRRSGRKVLAAAAAGFLALAVAAAPAQANSDADWFDVIQTEIAKFNQELSNWGADLAAKGEPARTGELTERSADCDDQASVRPFLLFGDWADYTPVPGGTFEDGAWGWHIENEARIVTTNSPYHVSGWRDRWSLAIPKGSMVTSRPLCVTEAHPTVRFFLSTKGSSRARLLVEVLYEDLGGSIKVLPIAYLPPSPVWQPTSIVPLHVNLRAWLAADRTAAIALRFTAMEDEGTWYLDDLFVDPFRAR